jgi:hypothetical protein
MQARNSKGTTTSSTEITFDTLASLNPPTNFNASPTSLSVNLSWTKGVGSTTTLIRYSYTEYPTLVTEGIELYSGAGSSYTQTGLNPGTTIYYSAWGISGANTSVTYTSLLITTIAGASSEVDMDSPIQPSNWFIDVDYTTQENMFYYDTINDIADDISVPRATLWSFIALLIASFIAFCTYLYSHSLLGAVSIMLVIMGLASSQWLLPGWTLLVSLAIVAGLGIAQQRQGI